MDSFYIHLQSDSSPAYFPDNKITDFRNQLAAPIEIDPNHYEVALVQCSYVYNPPYIRNGTEIGSIKYTQEATHVVEHKKIETSDTVTVKKYYTPKDKFDVYVNSHGKDLFYCETDNKQLSLDTEYVIFTEQKITCRLKQDVSSLEELTLQLNKELSVFGLNLQVNGRHADVVGFTEEKNTFIEFTNYMSHLYGFEAGLDQMPEYDPYNYTMKTGKLVFNATVIARKEVLYSYYDLPHYTSPVAFEIKYCEETDTNLWVTTHTFFASKDLYSVDQLINELSKVIPGVLFRTYNNLCSYVFDPKKFQVILPSSIQAILGTTETKSIITYDDKAEITGIYRPFFGQGQQKMYVYVDVIENQYIGDQVAPLLRIADYKGQPETTTTQEFAHHHYVNLRNVPLEQVHMYIRSETSDHLPIELGTFSATLHFRKKRF